MNYLHQLVRPLAALAAALIFVIPRSASAVELSTVLANIHQIGVTATVSLGHTAIGRTNYNRLTVSGTYTAACASGVMAPVTGQRSLSADAVLGGLSLYTTIPARLPATVDMPGYDQLPAGSQVACTYNWTSKAVEASYSYSVPGFGIQTGAGERSDGGTYPFVMFVPAESETAPREGCA